MDQAANQDTPPAGSNASGAQKSAPGDAVQTPTHGGSYLVDPDTGAYTLVECTKQRNEE
jgi:hypothetical protein